MSYFQSNNISALNNIGYPSKKRLTIVKYRFLVENKVSKKWE